MQTLSENHLHIISFDVPFPPDYGGVIDVYYKIKALHALGVKIHLHCFEYGRVPADELNKLCEEVYYYKRNLNKALLIHSSPFIVVSRRDKELLNRLKKDTYPILFEGLHSCFLFSNIALRQRRKFIRAHNVEHNYYRALSKAARNIFRKSYFKSEARKLESFEKIMTEAKTVFSISPIEKEELSLRYSNVELVLPFHGNETVCFTETKEKFVFYHGNLSVEENNKAALFLVEKVFRSIPHQLVIAGSKASKELREAAERRENVSLIEELTKNRIFEYIRKAQINILPTFQSTGIKLKLINVLFNGGHCLVNSTMVKGTGLEECCVIKDEIHQIRDAINAYMIKPFTEESLNKRERVLLEKFADQHNAQELFNSIFNV